MISDSTQLSAANSIIAVDLDNNGDLDVAATSAVSSGPSVFLFENQGGQFALATTDTAPPTIGEGQEDDVLRITMTHRGRTGDSDAELASLELRFPGFVGVIGIVPDEPEKEHARPADDGLTEPGSLSSNDINTIIDELRLYLDDGDGSFETNGDDTLVHSVNSLNLDGSGDITFTIPDNTAAAQVPFGTPSNFFLSTLLTSNAFSQSPNNFTVTHLTESSSTGEDASADIPISLEAVDNVASSTVTASENASPTISTIDDLTVTLGAIIPAIRFDISDAEDSASSLTVTASSDTPAVIPDANIGFLGSGGTRFLQLTPIATGSATITVTVEDSSASTNSESFLLTVTATPTIALTRNLPQFYPPGIPIRVSITATPGGGVTKYTVTETDFPAGWSAPSNISDGGTFGGGDIVWTDLTGSRFLTYVITPSGTGPAAFDGEADDNGSDGGGTTIPIGGDITTLTAPTQIYATWAAFFGVGPEGADDSGDGILNIADYAFGFDPTVNNSARLPKVALSGGATTLTLTYHRAKFAEGVTYNIQTSTNMVDWDPVLNPDHQIVSEDSASWLIDVTVPIPVPTPPAFFLRVEAVVTSP